MEAKVKKLENEVIVLRDELAKMKRFYEDLLYNLDDDNFSSKFLKEKNGMKTAISVTEEGIKAVVEKSRELENSISSVSQTAEEIRTEVWKNYETKTNAETKYSELFSSISQTAECISTKVSADQFKSYFEQTAQGFTFDGEQTRFSGVIYLTDEELNNKFSIFYDTSQGYEQILLHSTEATPLPIVLGNSSTEPNVYVGLKSDSGIVATRGWVQANPQPAVFG